jgi:PAS domain S-box-containing protein
MMTSRRPGRTAGPSVPRLDLVDPALYHRWVRTGTALTAVGYALVTVVGLLTHRALWYGFFSQAPTTVIAAAAWVMARRGRATFAALVTIGAMWLELQADVPLVGVRASALIAFPLLVMATGILRGARAAYVLAVATSLSVPLAALVGFGVRGEPVPDPGGMAYLVVVCAACMFAAAALVELGLDSFDRALAKVRASEERVAVLIAKAPVGIVVADADGYVLSVNPVAEKLLCADAASLRGMALREALLRRLADPGDPEKVAKLLDEDATVLLSLPLPAGNSVEVEALSTPLPWADGSMGVQLILRDVTERRRAEEKEWVVRLQLEHAQRLEAVGRLAGGVAHDFNNLLTVVGVSAEMLLDETEGAARDLARDILAAKIRGSALTKQLLAFARKDVVQVAELSVSDIVRAAGSLMKRFLGEDVDLVVDAHRDTPPVSADPAHVEQVIANLVINAGDALRGRGKVRIGAYPPGSERSWHGERWTVEPGYVELCVEDDGAGMDEETQARMFEPFFTTKPRGRSTGLGLSAVHGIMDQNGGRVRVLSEKDVGTCVLLYWPVSGGKRVT